MEGRVLGVYLLGVFLGALDTNVLGPVFPLLERSFHTTLAWTAWTVTIYTVAYVAATVLAGALGDRLGHKAFFTYGIVAFGVASVVAAVSPSLGLFLAARAIQGAGAGAVYPNAQAEGMRRFPPERRGLALGIFGATFGLASVLGPIVGGLIGQYLGWPWVFLINAPLALAVLGMARRLPASERSARDIPDPVGGVAFATFLASALLWIMAGAPVRWVAFAFAVVLGLVFWVRQRQAATPFLDTVPLASAAGVAVMVGAAIIGMDMSAAVFVPTLAQTALGFSVVGSGLALLPAAVSGALLAGAAGVLVDRIGPRPVLVVGLLAGTLGGLLLAWPHLSLARFLVAMVAFGLGTAFTMGAPLNRLGVGLYREDQAGEALALMAVFRSVGLAAGPVVLTVGERVRGFTGMFGIVAVLSAVGALLFAAVRTARGGAREALR
ncbi:MAG: MFS transporter [Actinomycetia bacterium]|nr:MFS transporter [Actinomycetes bacterium]